MFNMINIGERSGSGVPLIFNTWEDQGWNEPLIEERFDPDRTILSLDFSPKQAKETDDNIKKILLYLEKNAEAKTKDISACLGLSSSRTRALLSEMENIEALGTNTNRRYRLKEQD